MRELYTKVYGTEIIGRQIEAVTRNSDGTFKITYGLFLDADYDVFSEAEVEIREQCESCGYCEADCMCEDPDEDVPFEPVEDEEEVEPPEVKWVG